MWAPQKNHAMDATRVQRVLNWQPSPPDARDFKIQRTAAATTSRAATPARVDLAESCTSIKDQGSIGACTAFATVGALEYLLRKSGHNMAQDVFSERFTYYATRVNVAHWPPEDSGAYIRDAIKSAVQYGTCLEGTFPYNGDFSAAPPSSAYSEAKKHTGVKYATYDAAPTLATLATMKQAMANGYPIVGGFTCYSNIWNAVGGVIPLPNGQPIGGHAILLVGYDDAKQQLKFKNSWSARWGDGGYGYLPYQYFLGGNMSDLWTIFTAQDSGTLVDIEVVDPRVEPDARQAEVGGVLREVADNLDKAMVPNRRDAYQYFQGLLAQHPNNPGLRRLIQGLCVYITNYPR